MEISFDRDGDAACPCGPHYGFEVALGGGLANAGRASG
jgi:hypothetical protein